MDSHIAAGWFLVGWVFAYIVVVDATLDSLQALSISDDDWELVGEEDGVRIHKRETKDNPIVM